MDQKILIIIIITSVYVGIGIWEATVVYTYQTSINKTSYEKDGCIFTICKIITNILNGGYFLCLFNSNNNNNNNIFWKVLKSYLIVANIVTYIIGVSLFTILEKYGIFIHVIILEFIMYIITVSIIILLLLLLFLGKGVLINTPQVIVYVDNIEIVNINIPQIAVRADNIESVDINIPHATPI